MNSPSPGLVGGGVHADGRWDTRLYELVIGGGMVTSAADIRVDLGSFGTANGSRWSC